MNLSYISVKNLFFVKIKNKRTKQDTSLNELSYCFVRSVLARRRFHTPYAYVGVLSQHFY